MNLVLLRLGREEMRGCWGITKARRFCQRRGVWWLFCGDHKWQPCLFILAILAFMADFIGVISFITDQTSENHDAVISQGQDTRQDIQNLKTIMQNYIASNQEALLKKYPEGYILFAIDYRQELLPYKSLVLNNEIISFNLGEAKVKEMNKDNITLITPFAYTKPQYSKHKSSFERGYFSLSRKVGSTRIIMDIETIPKKERLHMVAEVLSNTDEGITCIIGFKKKHLST